VAFFGPLLEDDMKVLSVNELEMVSGGQSPRHDDCTYQFAVEGKTIYHEGNGMPMHVDVCASFTTEPEGYFWTPKPS
jgi:hypothetical protein